MIISPITSPALSALKTSRSSWNGRSGIRCSIGVTNVSAKYPYTTVGIPARTSKTGLIVRRILSGAYSER